MLEALEVELLVLRLELLELLARLLLFTALLLEIAALELELLIFEELLFEALLLLLPSLPAPHPANNASAPDKTIAFRFFTLAMVDSLFILSSLIRKVCSHELWLREEARIRCGGWLSFVRILWATETGSMDELLNKGMAV